MALNQRGAVSPNKALQLGRSRSSQISCVIGDRNEREHVFMGVHEFGQAFDVVFGADGDEAGAKYLMRRVLHFANGRPPTSDDRTKPSLS